MTCRQVIIRSRDHISGRQAGVIPNLAEGVRMTISEEPFSELVFRLLRRAQVNRSDGMPVP